jgi:penicillin-binding protein 1A
MAAAYGVFANRGVRLEATPIITVIDGNNKVIEDNTGRNGVRVLEENVADNVTDILRGVVTGGTGRRANINRPAAGKTGTTNDYKDAWFVGYTPTLSTAVWMGYSDKPRTMRLKGVGNVFGGSISAPTWGAYMKRALADVPVTDFSDPAPIKKLTSKQAKQVAVDASAALDAANSAGGDVNVAPGRQQQIPGTDPGSYDEGTNPPSVGAPPRNTPTTTSPPTVVVSPDPTTTTSTSPPTTTTTSSP